jgi:hypothetical protein
MKRLLIFLALLPLTLVFCETTPDPSVCEKAFDFRMSTAAELCENYEGCMPCECLDAGMAFDASDCVDPPAATCEGSALEKAETCLADETACASEMAATLDTICGTPLEE